MKRKFRKILVTGGSGFVGSHLVKRLKQVGFIVYRTMQSKGKKKTEKTVYGDISDWNFVDYVFRKGTFDACYHLASQPLVEKGSDDPRRTLRTNIEGTWNILEAARIYNVKRIIVASTIHIYGNNPRVPYKEYYIPRPSRIYETSKTCADIIAQSYITSYGSSIFIPRFCNIYGPGDLNFERLIPRTIKSIFTDKNPIMWGGKAMRDYLYIDDAIDAYVRLLNVDMEKEENHIFNFGTSDLVSVKDIIGMIIALSGRSDLKIEVEKGGRKDEVAIQYASWSKAKRLLGWSPKVNLKTGLIRTIAWYDKYLRQIK